MGWGGGGVFGEGVGGIGAGWKNGGHMKYKEMEATVMPLFEASLS